MSICSCLIYHYNDHVVFKCAKLILDTCHMHHSSPEQNQQIFPIATTAKRVEVTRNEPLVRIVGIVLFLRP